MFESKFQEVINYPSKPYITLLALPFLFYAAKKYYNKWYNEKSNFYLINDLCLIKEILNACQTNKSCVESELKQPYLLIDTNLKYKLNEMEFENNIIDHFLSRYVQSSREILINVIIRKKFKELILKKRKSSPSIIYLEPKDINILVFKILTGYIVYLFGRCKNKSKIKFKNFKLIFKYLMSINKYYNLDLFLENHDEKSNQYKKNFALLMKAIKSQFELRIDDHDQDPKNNFNFDYVKFLIIKKIYLDFTQISSALMTFLNDLTLNNNDELVNEIRNSNGKFSSNGEIWKHKILDKCSKNYLILSINMDLFLVKNDLALKVPSSGKEYNFLKNSFIGINIGSLIKEKNCMDKTIFEYYYRMFSLDNPNNIAILITKSMVFNFVRNLNFFQNEDKLSNDKICFFNFYK